MTEVERQMEILGISYEEAVELVEFDQAVDNGFIPENEPTADQKKKMRKEIGVYDAPKTPTKRERKADDEKYVIMSTINEALTAIGCDIQITNAEREYAITFNGREFKLLLTATRASKS